MSGLVKEVVHIDGRWHIADEISNAYAFTVVGIRSAASEVSIRMTNGCNAPGSSSTQLRCICWKILEDITSFHSLHTLLIFLCARGGTLAKHRTAMSSGKPGMMSSAAMPPLSSCERKKERNTLRLSTNYVCMYVVSIISMYESGIAISSPTKT